MTWPTSYEALVGRAELKAGTFDVLASTGPSISPIHLPGEWVLVTAAAGGVGIAAVQLAKGTVTYEVTACVLISLSVFV